PPPAAPPPQAAPTTPVSSGPALRPALPSAPPPAVEPPAPKAVEAPPPPKPTPAPIAKAHPAPAPAPAKVAGGAAVQIGAVSSTAIADKAWNEAVAVAPGLAAGKGKGVEKIEKGGHVLYRTAVTGFATKADAAAFCGKLKAAGKACFVK
ncbi:MAG: hypothetical protein JWQ97_2240, partial [Phenylobacterium sp.]|nr:hypothetical protein [Phenylobacterium sp.]